MRLFKATYTEGGQKRFSKKHYLDFFDHNEVRHRIPAFEDKRQSEAMGAKIKDLIGLRAGRMTPEPEIQRWIDGLPKKLLRQFVSWDLVSSERVAVGQSLEHHLEDWKTGLLARGATKRHAEQSNERVKAVLNGCGFQTLADLSASRVQRFIGGLDISDKTKNYYLRECKSFCRWMVHDRRASENVLEYLRPLKINKGRPSRRSLEPAEITRLFEATRAGGARYGMEGHQRILLYRLALETGIRANEIRSLKVGSFDLKRRTVTVAAPDTKNRKEAELPLRPRTAYLLAQEFKGKELENPAFRLPSKYDMAQMLYTDLASAGINHTDDGSGKLDFHSLRHTFGSLLAASGVHPKVAQVLMRHSDVNLTMNVYTHTLVGQEAEAVARLPDFSIPSQAQAQAKTGTDDVTAGTETFASHLASSLLKTGGFRRTSLDESGQMANSRNATESPTGAVKRHSRFEKPLGALGVEPRTDGLKVRCSTD